MGFRDLEEQGERNREPEAYGPSGPGSSRDAPETWTTLPCGRGCFDLFIVGIVGISRLLLCWIFGFFWVSVIFGPSLHIIFCKLNASQRSGIGHNYFNAARPARIFPRCRSILPMREGAGITSRLEEWLKRRPKLRDCKRQSNILQALVRSPPTAKQANFQRLHSASSGQKRHYQGLQAARQANLLQTLVEAKTEAQGLQAAKQHSASPPTFKDCKLPSKPTFNVHILQALVQSVSYYQGLQAAGQAHLLQTLVEAKTEAQGLKAAKQHSASSGYKPSYFQGLQAARQANFQRLHSASSGQKRLLL